MKVVDCLRFASTLPSFLNQGRSEPIDDIIKHLPKVKPFVFSKNLTQYKATPLNKENLFLPFELCSFEPLFEVILKDCFFIGSILRENKDLSVDELVVTSKEKNIKNTQLNITTCHHNNYGEFWKNSISAFLLSYMYDKKTLIGVTKEPVKTKRIAKYPEFVKKLIIITSKKRTTEDDTKELGKIDWKHQWRVRGHWRKINDSSLGKDREGKYTVIGNTWVNNFIKGNGPLIEKTRFIQGENA